MTTHTAGLPPITRPNGKTYRPRKLIAQAVADCDGEDLAGVVVFGTHDAGRAKRLADRYVALYGDADMEAVNPDRVWWRDTFSWGSRRYEDDDRHGRAGVRFDIDYRTPEVTP